MKKQGNEKMKFRTEITTQPAKLRIAHNQPVLMLGSCFAENMAGKMEKSGFKICLNPFGIVYNPESTAGSLCDVMQKRIYTETDLFEYQGVYHSFAHHSRFSSTDSQQVLEKINTSIAAASDFLFKTEILIVTFGTASVYRLKDSGKIVSNCHKLPADRFQEERLTIHQIIGRWNEIISNLRSINPQIHVIFTVSPIRHWKDGAHANQLNKAVLLLAINELLQSDSHCYYFPAYEIMLDDLRDYRFYADDLIHPNNQAIEYIWEKFGDSYFDASVKETGKIYEKQQKILNHRPLIG
jgi:hypothetical protein